MDQVRILIKILAESHMAFNLEDKIDIRWHTDRQTSPKGQSCSTHFKALHGKSKTPAQAIPDKFIFRLVCSAHGHEEEE